MKSTTSFTPKAQLLLLVLAAGCGTSQASSGTGGSTTNRSATGGTSSASATNGGSGTGVTSSTGSSTSGETTPPTVLSNAPLSGAIGVPLNTSVSATFSEAMDPATLTTATFTVTSGTPAVAVPGTVLYASTKAVFWPTNPLTASTAYTATLTTGAKDAAEMALAASYGWSFTTGTAAVIGVPVDLGTAAQYVILAETGISTVTASTITGNLGINPYAASAITGFGLNLVAGSAYATSTQVIGDIYAPGYADPTHADLITATGDMGTAFTAAAARAPDVTELGAGDISGLTLRAGVYSWSTGLLLATDVTLTGDATDVWIFQIAQGLTVSNGVILHLTGGALPQNVFWQVSGSVTLGTTVQFAGVILGQTMIALQTGASMTGQLLAQSAVTLDANALVAP